MTAPQRNEQPFNRSRPEPAGRVLLFDRRPRGRRAPLYASGADLGYTMPAHQVQEFVRLAIKHRWDLPAFVRMAKISPPTHLHHCLEITRSNVTLGTQHLWRVADDDLMGLGRISLPSGALRLLAFALCSAPTLATAVTRYGEFRAALPGLPALTVDQSGDIASLSIDLAALDACVGLVSEGLLAVVHRVINWAIRRPLVLRRVEVAHPRPAGPTNYHIVFGAPTLFDATKAALVFNADVLAEPLVRSHDDVERFLEDAPASLLAECDFYTSHSDRVRRIIEDRLGNPPCTIEQIAAGVGMSRPTLWRRLREENTSISEIRDQVLREAALTSLARGDETIAELSQRLGFSEPSAFSRAFRRWTGYSPSNYQTR